MYRDTDYLSYSDLDNIEELIDYVIDRLKVVSVEYLKSNSKTWFPNEFPYIQEIDRIEKLIDNCGKNYYLPEGWQECKVWLTGNETEQVIKSFSYEDINRWIINLQLLKAIVDTFTFSTSNGRDIEINLPVESRFRNFKLYGDTQQQTYSGKNLFDSSKFILNNGTTNQIEENKITVTTITSGSNKYSLFKLGGSELLGKTLTCKSIMTGTTGGIRFYYLNSSNNPSSSVPGRYFPDNDKFTITLPNEFPTNAVSIGILFYSNFDTNNNVTMTFENTQVEIGSSATSYEQYVGGTPSPNPDFPQEVQTVSGLQVVDITGRNLLYIPDGTYESLQDSTKTITFVNGVGTPNFTSVSSALNIKIQIPEITLPAGTYTINDFTNKKYPYFQLKNGNTNIIYAGSGELGKKTDTLSETKTINMVDLYFGSTTQTYGELKPQLEKGNQATTYEEYKGQQFEINLGKNLFTTTDNFVQVVGQTTYEILGTNSLSVTSTQTNYSYRYVKFKLDNLIVGKTYYIRAKAVNTNENASKCLYVRNSADNRTLNSNENWQDTSVMSFVPTETTVIIRFYATGNTALINTCIWSDIMVSTSADTTYSPYKTPIELCKIGEYQDFIDGTVDNWYINKYVGTYNINTTQITLIDAYSNIEYASFVKARDFLGFGSYDKIEIICNKAQWISSPSWNSSNNIGKISGNANQWNWWLGFTKGTGLTTIQEKLANTKIYYPLATPTREKITDSELNSQLNNIAKNKMFEGYNHITITGDLPGILDIEYLSNTGDRTTIWNGHSEVIWNQESDIDWRDE